MSVLERRYRRLLRAYPARYRRQRGEEMLGTLLESTPPGRRWPAVREGRALLAGGLRVRSGLDQRLAMAAHLRLAALLGVVLMLLQLATWDVQQFISFWRGWHAAEPGAGHMAAYLVLTVAVLAAAFFAPRRLAALLAWLTAALWFWWDGNHGDGMVAGIVLITLAMLVRGQQRMPRIWLCVPGAMLALHVLPELGFWRQSPYFIGRILLGMAFWWLILGCTVLWIVIDPRPAIGAALYVAFIVAESYSPFAVQPQVTWQLAGYAIGAAIVAPMAIWQLHRAHRGGPGKDREDDPELAELGGPETT